MKKSNMTLQHRFVGYMIFSTLLILLLSYGLSFWVQNLVQNSLVPSEALLLQNIEAATVAVTPTTAATVTPKTAPVDTVVVTGQVSPTSDGTLAAQTVPAEQIKSIAIQGIGAIKGDLIAVSQRRYMALLAGLLILQFIGSMVWVRYMLVKPVHETVEKIDTLTMGNYQLEPCMDGRHELDHLNHQLYVLSEELRQNKIDRESEAAQRKSLIAGMSHDLKTPLTNICGYAETLMMEKHMGDQQRGWLEIIMRNARTANHLIDDLLDLNRYDLQQYPVNLSEIQIPELLLSCMDDFKDILQQSGQLIVFKGSKANESLKGSFKTDKVLLLRLIKNVLSNFHQHAGEHSVLHMAYSLAEDGLTLTFKDNGVGVAREHVPHLTDIFYIADPSRNKKGSSGLGLYNCQQIVKLLGGRMELESDTGKGLALTITIEKSE